MHAKQVHVAITHHALSIEDYDCIANSHVARRRKLGGRRDDAREGNLLLIIPTLIITPSAPFRVS